MVFEKAGISTIAVRRLICRDCPAKRSEFKILWITIFKKDQCSKCKCIIELKIKLKDEKCPLGKW